MEDRPLKRYRQSTPLELDLDSSASDASADETGSLCFSDVDIADHAQMQMSHEDIDEPEFESDDFDISTSFFAPSPEVPSKPTTSSKGARSHEGTNESEFESDDFDISTSFFAPSPEVPSKPTTSSKGAFFQKPLYEGAPSDLTEYMGNLLIFQYSIRHSLTTKALAELLNMMSVFLPPDARVPKTVYQLKKFFLTLYPEQTPVMQGYCERCHSFLKEAKSCACDGATSQFVTVPLGPQLKARLQNQDVWDALFHKEQIAGTNMHDISHGRKYKELQNFTSSGNLTMVANTDGVQLFKSSSVSMWPIWVSINELPVGMRFSKKNMILAALWCSKDKPTMNTYLKPLMDSANDLYHKGIEVLTPCGTVKTVKAALVAMSCDLPARALVLNMRQFNGVQGCHLCEDHGETAGGRNQLFRWWPPNPSSVSRTKQSLSEASIEATTKGEITKGVKSVSILSIHLPFNICEGVVIDSLHCLYLGVTNKILKMWFGKDMKSKEFSIRSKTKLCDERLLFIEVPDRISRIPKSIADFKRWKGSELKSWLLYYSLPVLKDILPQTFFDHYGLLVRSVHILDSDNISPEELDQAANWLKKFYQQYKNLYGEKNCTMNIHLLGHLTECVRDWGPLWGYSCFAFESANNSLRKLFHGTKDMSKQMAFTYVLNQVVSGLTTTDTPSTKVQHLSNILFGHKSYNRKKVAEGIWIVGDVGAKTELSDDEIEVLGTSQGNNRTVVPIFKRLYKDGQTFFCAQYTRVKKRNSYTIKYGPDEKYGQIQYFILREGKATAMVKKIVHQAGSSLDPIITAEPSSDLAVIDVAQIKEKVIFMRTSQSSSYIVKFPSSLNID